MYVQYVFCFTCRNVEFKNEQDFSQGRIFFVHSSMPSKWYLQPDNILLIGFRQKWTKRQFFMPSNLGPQTQWLCPNTSTGSVYRAAFKEWIESRVLRKIQHQCMRAHILENIFLAKNVPTRAIKVNMNVCAIKLLKWYMVYESTLFISIYL